MQKASDAINAFKNWLKARDRLKAASNRLQAAIRECNSFAPGTKVVLADGTSKPIEQIRTGAQTGGATWHGYVVTWQLLDQKSKNIFIRAGIFNRKGKAL
ncbi:hypothetical protein ACFFR3_23780 [Nonomuraea salmonea]|uniref:Transposase n=1 Tax=Nonomuraea salmonea TaxID=46181 RepID=A0ABV5NS76_9ACTN